MTQSQALPQEAHSGVGGAPKYRWPCSLECVLLIHSAWESSGLPRTCWVMLGAREELGLCPAPGEQAELSERILRAVMGICGDGGIPEQETTPLPPPPGT